MNPSTAHKMLQERGFEIFAELLADPAKGRATAREWRRAAEAALAAIRARNSSGQVRRDADAIGRSFELASELLDSLAPGGETARNESAGRAITGVNSNLRRL
ncbi:MAG: hypothetical protein AAF628_22955 [Planctomycetota bacterium]